ncbi:hypothetical protein C8Q78DRAFT_995425 [Trametes maxima]|nr:hypothetical protein C8Q78DRAFT_995425 [Trametes maxima]
MTYVFSPGCLDNANDYPPDYIQVPLKLWRRRSMSNVDPAGLRLKVLGSSSSFGSRASDPTLGAGPSWPPEPTSPLRGLRGEAAPKLGRGYLRMGRYSFQGCPSFSLGCRSPVASLEEGWSMAKPYGGLGRYPEGQWGGERPGRNPEGQWGGT